MTVHLKRQLFTVKEFYKMAEVGIIQPDARVELLNGEIIQMSPIKSHHAGVVDFLSGLLNSKYFGKYNIRTQNPIRINRHSEPEPDVAVAKFQKDSYKSKHPKPSDVLLLIEVSDSTLLKDRKVKLPIYAKAGIEEYWIVNLVDEQIEVYKNPEGEKYTSKKKYKKGSNIKCEKLDFKLAVSDVF